MSNNTNTKQSDANALVLAVEKLLDYHRRNSPMNFQYEKYLDYIHLLTITLEEYKAQRESRHSCKVCNEMVETDGKLDARGIIEICPKCYTEK